VRCRPTLVPDMLTSATSISRGPADGANLTPGIPVVRSAHGARVVERDTAMPLGALPPSGSMYRWFPAAVTGSPINVVLACCIVAGNGTADVPGQLLP
jgi:hypothetical protein